MATMTIGGLRPATHTRSAATGPVTTTLLARISASWTAWMAERAMAALDDRALDDIGVSRSEISHAVRTGERA